MSQLILLSNTPTQTVPPPPKKKKYIYIYVNSKSWQKELSILERILNELWYTTLFGLKKTFFIEGSNFLECYIVLTGRQFWTFQSIIVPSSSGPRNARQIDPEDEGTKTVICLLTNTTQHNICPRWHEPSETVLWEPQTPLPTKLLSKFLFQHAPT